MTKVLLVEDDNNLREIYEARLAAEGYEISTAKDGEDALAVAKQQKPDLIISDVMMPRISGFEMLDILRNTDGLKHTKIIMLTALGQAEDKTRANSLGADRYLVKSQVTLEDIVKAADELLNPDAYADSSSDDTSETGQADSFSPNAAAPLAAAAHETPPPAGTPSAPPEAPTLSAIENQQAPLPAVAPAAPAAAAGAAAPQLAPDLLATPPATPPATVDPAAGQAVATDPAVVAAPPTTPTPPEPTTAAAATAVQPAIVSTDVTQPAPDPVAAVPPAITTTEVPAMPVVETPPEATLPDADTEAPIIQMPPAPESELATADVQSTSQEAATVEQQIENFEQTVQAAPAVEPTPEPAADPAPVANNEALIEDAANELHNAEPSENNTPGDLPDKKVIVPPAAEEKTDLQTLLAAEEAKENAKGSVNPASAEASSDEPKPAEPAPAPAPAETPVVPVATPPSETAPAPSPAPVATAPEPAANGPIAPPPEGIFTPNQGNSANDEAL